MRLIPYGKPMRGKPRAWYQLTFSADVTRIPEGPALRRLLKRLLRAYGFKNEGLVELPGPPSADNMSAADPPQIIAR
jgi:hypothetical protein